MMLCSFYRLCTFLDYYFPAGGKETPELLAEIGLYMCGDGSTLQCRFCFDMNIPISDVQAMGQEIDKNFLVKWHEHMSPYCSFRHPNTHNVSLSQQDHSTRYDLIIEEAFSVS
jgi:hypothetical protein